MSWYDHPGRAFHPESSLDLHLREGLAHRTLCGLAATTAKHTTDPQMADCGACLVEHFRRHPPPPRPPRAKYRPGQGVDSLSGAASTFDGNLFGMAITATSGGRHPHMKFS